MTSVEIYLTVEEVAGHFHVSEQHLRLLLRERRVPGLYVGSQWLIPRSVLGLGLQPSGMSVTPVEAGQSVGGKETWSN